MNKKIKSLIDSKKKNTVFNYSTCTVYIIYNELVNQA
jgi:hypothetical protein